MPIKFGMQTVTIASVTHRTWLQTEMRVQVNYAKVEQYAQEMKDGAVFPAPVVFVDQRTDLYRVGDGFHRILAARANALKVIEVDLRRGGYTEAVLCNIEQNIKQHGLPFGFGDMKKCVITLLTNKDTKEWAQVKIAETVGCSRGYVSQVASKECLQKNGPRGADTTNRRKRRTFELLGQGYSRSEIAKELDVSLVTIHNYLSKDKSFIRCPHCNGSGYVVKDD